jgi:hypothetical protein
VPPEYIVLTRIPLQRTRLIRGGKGDGSPQAWPAAVVPHNNARSGRQALQVAITCDESWFQWDSGRNRCRVVIGN